MTEYIERDIMLAKFIEGDGDDDFTEGYNFAVNEYRDKLKAIPATNVQPVKRGEWVWNSEPIFGNPYGSYECSECGNRADFKDDYCCSCGAKMKNAE